VTQFVNLHTHTHYSLMDGVATAEEYVNRAKANGMTALAITDHGTLSGHADFHRACIAGGIKPILGVEAYYTEDRFDRRDRADRKEPLDLIYNHLTLIAINDNGLKNLHKMMEIAWTEGYFHKPRIDWEILEEYGDDIIIGSGCMSGPINKAIEVGDFNTARSIAMRFKIQFKDNFYIEVMPHNIKGMNSQLLRLADDFGIKAIVTSDCHHATEDQRVVQEMTLLLNTHQKTEKGVTYTASTKYDNMMDRLDYLYGSDRQMTFREFDIHLMSYDEMQNKMKEEGIDRSDIYANTVAIGDSIQDYTIATGLDLLPVEYADPDKTLRAYSIKALKDRGLTDQVYRDRLDEELQVIRDKHFAPYFLMVRNITNYAHQQDILMSPGRGSAAGSLVAYALGITQLDPIKHNLLFFRFIDASRDDAPDIDLDFEDTRREEVKEFVRRKYKNVASIATFTDFGDKSVVRDVSRVLNVPLDRVNAMLKHVSTWQDFTRSKHELVVQFRNDFPEVVNYSSQLHGRIRGTGIHASGVVASKVTLNTVAPIETRSVAGSKERLTIVAVDKDEAADIGLIKMDILGLKTLTVIHDTLNKIQDRWGMLIDLSKLTFDDPDVYEMLNKGLTKGVFQLEAGPYTNLLMKMKVNSLDELAASNALVRPGAANTIGKEYLDRKQGKKPVKYPHKSMEPYLKNTYGCILYQEQVMQACVVLGGMTMAEANKVRKIIGKKKDASEFDEFKMKFYDNARDLVGDAKAEELWHDFEAHAGYSFNLSHAVAYSTLSYYTAWLKKRYPIEFFWALLNNEKNSDSISEYLIEAKRMGIIIRLPHINLSDVSWKIEGDNALRFGLRNIKYISDVSAQRFIDARPFDSYEEIVNFVMKKGSGVNSRALESMRKIGAVTINAEELIGHEEALANSYEILGLPVFNDEIPDHWRDKMTNGEDYNDGDTAIMYGYVRSVKNGGHWQLYDVMDSTGGFKFFGNPKVDIEVGKSYLFLISDKTVVAAVSDLNGGSTLEQYLDSEVNSGFVVAAASRKTKTGAKMGTVVFDEGGKLIAATIFASKFSQLAPSIKIGNHYTFMYGPSRSGGYVLNGVKTQN
jgi:DNA polymerase III subunit alpha